MRLGIDLGGTKIEIIALGDGGRVLVRDRVPTPRSSYDDVIRAMRDLVLEAESKTGERGTLGIAIPGTISAATGFVKNANSTQLLGHPLDQDLGTALARPVRVANDANCFALSEATDGAAKGKNIVFGIIAGTGVGGGISTGGRVLVGAHGIAGEWGHNPLPGMSVEELEIAPRCYCGKAGCIEAWCSGPSLAAQFKKISGRDLQGTEIAAEADRGDERARIVMALYFDRFARAIASVVNILDPDAIVLGGGLSNIEALYLALPPLVERYAFMPEGPTAIVKNMHGDSSGVRGAAWLWGEDGR